MLTRSKLLSFCHLIQLPIVSTISILCSISRLSTRDSNGSWMAVQRQIRCCSARSAGRVQPTKTEPSPSQVALRQIPTKKSRPQQRNGGNRQTLNNETYHHGLGLRPCRQRSLTGAGLLGSSSPCAKPNIQRICFNRRARFSTSSSVALSCIQWTNRSLSAPRTTSRRCSSAP